jgi:hypothetical protein
METRARVKATREILSPTRQIEFLESLALVKNRFRNWLELAMKGNTAPIYVGEVEVYEKVVNWYSLGSPKLQQGIRDTVSYLVRAWNGSYDSLSYLENLLFLVGKLRVVDAYEDILRWICQRRFVEKYPDIQNGIGDLHLSCLRAIALQGPGDKRLVSVCLRDIKLGQYFGICYRILYEDDFAYLIKYFPEFVRHCMTGQCRFENQFYYFRKLHRDAFNSAFQELLELLEMEEQFYLIQRLYDAEARRPNPQRNNVILQFLRSSARPTEVYDRVREEARRENAHAMQGSLSKNTLIEFSRIGARHV